MKRRPYPRYKASGIEWLGDVPEHWSTRRLKLLLKEHLKYGANESAEIDDPELPRYVRITDIDEKGGLRDETFRSLPTDAARDYLLEDGDVLFARSGATSGKTFLYRNSWGACAYAGYLIRARPDQSKLEPKFLRHFTDSKGYWQWLSASFIQATIQNVSAEKYGDLSLPIPPLIEQRAIASFLDRETERIDKLVAKKRELIERLREKRAALISRTVTRGLPPETAAKAGLPANPPLKDSGVEWLGKIPAHWEALPLFRVSEMIQTGPFGSQLHAADYVEGGIPLINPAHIGSGKITPDELSCIDTSTAARLARHCLVEGDIVMGRRGEMGRCAAVGTTEAGWLCGTGSLVIRLRSSSAKYFATVLACAGIRDWLELHAVGTTMQNLNPTIVGRIPVPVPPLSEQTFIATYLDAETTKLDTLAAKVEEAIERLQEYRTALITAAVTGKIDARGGVDA